MSITNKISDQIRFELIQKLHTDILLFSEKLQKEAILHVNCVTAIDELQELWKIKKLNHEIIYQRQTLIAEYLCKGFPQLKNQLLDYWNAWSIIFKNTSPAPINIRETVEKHLADMNEIDDMYKEVLTKDPLKDNVALYALFYMHNMKSEKTERALYSDLEKFKNLIPEYDLNKIFSVGEKVPRQSKKSKETIFVTHAKALRDSLSHKKYTVNRNSKVITFKNTTHGYNFIEEFEILEFIHYIQSTDLMYRTMFILQTLIIWTTLLHEAVDKFN